MEISSSRVVGAPLGSPNGMDVLAASDQLLVRGAARSGVFIVVERSVLDGILISKQFVVGRPISICACAHQHQRSNDSQRLGQYACIGSSSSVA